MENYKSGFFKKLAVSGLVSIASLIGCSPKNDYLTNSINMQRASETTYNKGNPHPTLEIMATPTEGYAPLGVTFTTRTIIPGSGQKTLLWDFNNDGIIDSDKHDPVFVYEQPGGVFRPVLTVISEKEGTYDISGLEIIVHGDFVTPSNLRLVSANTTGENDGRTWDGAYSDLQSALTAAADSNGEIKEIWVAKGTYKPTNSGDRSVAFKLVNGLRVYGGFLGAETDPSQRDFSNQTSLINAKRRMKVANNRYSEVLSVETAPNQSVLSGDLKGDDGANFTNREDNSLHVVTFFNEFDLGFAVLDGFIVKGGYADNLAEGLSPDRGAGLIGYNMDLTIDNCIFTDDYAIDNGAGMFVERSKVLLRNCQFVANTANAGAGMVNQGDSRITLESCIFMNNVANGLVDPRSGGGGLYNSTSEISLTNCKFTGNSASYGAAMANWDSSPNVISCLFSNNIAAKSGGAVLNSGAGGVGSNPKFINCTFRDNSASERSGGIANIIGIVADGVGGSSTLLNSIFWGNSDMDGNKESSQVFDDGSGKINVDYSGIQGLTGILGGIGNIDSDPLFGDLDGRLSVDSKCINAGTNDTDPALPSTDLDGNPRIVGGIVDMGAYEFQK